MISKDLQEKIEKSKKALRLSCEMAKEFYDKPLILCYSGGKDSDVLLHLAENCLKPDDFIVQHSLTTVDAPPTVRHIKEQFKRLEEKGIQTQIDYHEYTDENGVKRRHTMWNMIPEKGIAPTRLARWCCSMFKEMSTPNAIACLGVRGGESTKRRGRDIFGVRGGSYRTATFFHSTTQRKYLKKVNLVTLCGIVNLSR